MTKKSDIYRFDDENGSFHDEINEERENNMMKFLVLSRWNKPYGSRACDEMALTQYTELRLFLRARPQPEALLTVPVLSTILVSSYQICSRPCKSSRSLRSFFTPVIFFLERVAFFP
jgi:hypothetical protein